MSSNHYRNLTPPAGGINTASGTYKVEDEDEEEEQITSPGNPNWIQGQQFFSIFDGLSAAEKQELIALVTAYSAMRPTDKSIIVYVAERMAGI